MAVQKFTDSGFWATLEKLSDLALVNLLWIICSLPVVTIPISTAGLFGATIDNVRGRETQAYLQFFRAMRRFWAKSLLIALIDIAIGLLVTLNFLIVSRLGMPFVPGAMSLSMSAFVGMVTLAANLYIWTLLVVYDLPLRDLIYSALRMVFLHPVWSLLMLAVALGVTLIGISAPAVIWIFGLFSGIAWLMNRAAWQIIQQYDEQLNTSH
jgi:uncharacterized membrane protein YesL